MLIFLPVANFNIYYDSYNCTIMTKCHILYPNNIFLSNLIFKSKYKIAYKSNLNYCTEIEKLSCLETLFFSRHEKLSRHAT